MNENIDLTKILKDCPIGWEFYSSIYGYVTFHKIENGSEYPIKFFYINKNNSKNYGSVTKQGLHVFYFNGECTLFPSKDQRDWSKFTAPWYNKKMDIIAWLEKQGKQEEPQVYEIEDGKIITYSKTDGYKFVEPKFKVGDKIVNVPMKYMGGSWTQGTISKITEDKYIFTDGSYTSISSQDSWELVHDKKSKFDPKTLQPYDKVLVRRGNENYNVWFPDFVSDPPNNDNNKTLCMCVGDDIAMVIPYNNDTKHLIGTTDEAPEFYRYWED